MKKRTLLVMLCLLALTAMLAASCSPSETTQGNQSSQTSGSSTLDKSYNAMNPVGLFIPVETKALSPRLDTIDGKTIYVCQGEADPVIMPALYKMLVKDYPKTKFIYYDRSDFGPSRPGTGGVATSTNEPEDPDILSKVDAVIRGNGW